MQNKLQNRIREAESSLDEERRMLKDANEELNREHKKYVDDAERHAKELRNNYDKMVHEYSSRIEEQERYIDQMKHSHSNQISSKDTEIYDLQLNQRT
mmetsp:Transcript_15369/g.13113  ORF Transcript_15369/g.13113 Transcript_15369/m.13113 type:complete len:98 (+) Transcript_15369:1123-1416(+)